MANTDSKKLTRAQRKSEMVTNRLSILFCIGVFIVACLLIVQGRGGRAMWTVRTYVCPALMIISVLAIIGCIIWHAKIKKSGIAAKEDIRLFNPSYVGAFFAGLFILAFMYHTVFQTNQNYKTVIVAVVLLALAFIYDTYGRDFFAFSVITVIGAVLLKAQGNGFSFENLRTVIFSVMQMLSFVYAVAVILSVLLITDKNGRLCLGKKKIQFIGKGADKNGFAILGGILLILNVLGFIFPAMITYMLVALLSVYIIFGIIYTVKQLSK